MFSLTVSGLIMNSTKKLEIYNFDKENGTNSQPHDQIWLS